MKFKILPILLFFIFSFSCDKKESENKDINPEPIAEQDLLEMVQKDAIKYFWDYAETNSKLARERYHVDEPYLDQNTITTGGSGFGFMNIIVGIQNGYINRTEAVQRLNTALDFLGNADRFHGAWSHWIDGTNGNVIPFGTIDNGGDIVETSYLCQGLICLREYFKDGSPDEKALAQKADSLWKGVEWSWYTKGEDALYWHWSPNYEWQINFKIEGYNECLITYLMAASSTTYPITDQAYHKGWARNGSIKTDRKSYNIPLIFNHNGTNTVGSLFWSHYSYLGLNPKGLSDDYADYWQLNVNHTKIIHDYCIANPLAWKGYNENCWGLTASYSRNIDGSVGYTDHRPGNDRGVISPTAALSSYPYTPTESLKLLRFLYEDSSKKYVGLMGPYDAFSVHHNWITKRYLAIDQGTIAPMIENYKTGLIWNLFMNAPEIQHGLKSLGFHSSEYNF